MMEKQKLSQETLELRYSLPACMDPVELSCSAVRLAPLVVSRDSNLLYEVSNGQAISNKLGTTAAYDADRLIWVYMNAGPFARHDDFVQYLQALQSSTNGLAMTVFAQETGIPVGIATFMNNVPEHLKVELGGIWYSPLVQGKGYNLIATYLMLKHVFELGYRRVEWKCNALNERSRRSALRMGFEFEGVQESHFIIKEQNRDTAWFRMLDREWPEKRLKLERLISELAC